MPARSGAEAAQQDFSRWRKLKISAAAIEQRNTELPLKQGDLPADRGRRNIDLARRCPDRSSFGNRKKMPVPGGQERLGPLHERYTGARWEISRSPNQTSSRLLPGPLRSTTRKLHSALSTKSGWCHTLRA